MTTLETLFWLSAGCVVYTYALYPLLIALMGRLRGRVHGRRTGYGASVSFVVAAHNEADSVRRRLSELIDQITNAGVDGEVILVSDGSTDGTAPLARSLNLARVRVIELAGNLGKASALTAGCKVAANEIIVFADMRQTWAPDALKLLLENFADPTIGAVSGDLAIESAPGVMAGVGLYWRFEKWLRRQESKVHSTVGVTGAICAVRRELFRPIPPGTILDDVYWPLQVAMQGYRVVHDDRAHAFDRLPEKTRDEFRRKVRTLSGNWQLATRSPMALLPWRNPLWVQFLSHKLLRLLVPWALLALLVLSLLLSSADLSMPAGTKHNLALSGRIYFLALFAQIGSYLLAMLGMRKDIGSSSRLAGGAASFLVLNSAAWLGFWVWAIGRSSRSWSKIRYQESGVRSQESGVRSQGSGIRKCTSYSSRSP